MTSHDAYNRLLLIKFMLCSWDIVEALELALNPWILKELIDHVCIKSTALTSLLQLFIQLLLVISQFVANLLRTFLLRTTLL
jgi:hypothetical protein